MATAPHSLVVITYNIRLGIQEGVPALAAALSDYEPPDILAIQEVGEHWTMGPPGSSTTELARLLGLSHFVHIPAICEKGPDGNLARYGHALLSRWPISSPLILNLPRQADEPRTLLRAQIEIPGHPVEILSTHLSYLPSDRPAQGEFLLRWLREHKTGTQPRFFLGDLNADLRDDPRDQWLQHFHEHWQEADRELARLTYPSSDPRLRLDYIFARNARCTRVELGQNPAPSDHFPLFSTWEIGD